MKTLKILSTLSLGISLAASLALAGCAGDTGTIGDGSSTPAEGDATVYTRTIVHMNADGTSTVTEEPITAGEQQAEMAQAQEDQAAALANGGKVAYAITTASCGNWYATKFFDQAGYKGNELCLLGDGFATLSSYCRLRFRNPYTGTPGGCVRTWQGSIASLWTGQSPLWIENNGGPTTYCEESLPAYEAQSTPDTCDQQAYEIAIGNIIH